MFAFNHLSLFSPSVKLIYPRPLNSEGVSTEDLSVFSAFLHGIVPYSEEPLETATVVHKCLLLCEEREGMGSNLHPDPLLRTSGLCYQLCFCRLQKTQWINWSLAAAKCPALGHLTPEPPTPPPPPAAAQ